MRDRGGNLERKGTCWKVFYRLRSTAFCSHPCRLGAVKEMYVYWTLRACLNIKTREGFLFEDFWRRDSFGNSPLLVMKGAECSMCESKGIFWKGHANTLFPCEPLNIWKRSPVVPYGLTRKRMESCRRRPRSWDCPGGPSAKQVYTPPGDLYWQLNPTWVLQRVRLPLCTQGVICHRGSPGKAESVLEKIDLKAGKWEQSHGLNFSSCLTSQAREREACMRLRVRRREGCSTRTNGE